MEEFGRILFEAALKKRNVIMKKAFFFELRSEQVVNQHTWWVFVEKAATYRSKADVLTEIAARANVIRSGF